MLKQDFDFDLDVEYTTEDKKLTIRTSNSSGADYECNTVEELKDYIIFYIDTYIMPINYQIENSKIEMEDHEI